MNNTIEKFSNITTKAVFSKDKKKRYLLELNFNTEGKKACIIMLYPSQADEFIIDQTTQLVRNNAINQGYSTISIVNIFCTIDSERPESDRIDSSTIAEVCSNSEIIIIAFGRGTSYTEEKERLIEVLKVYKDKLYSIIDNTDKNLSHPLSPKARIWNISKLELDNI